jgi:hypothetical protein
MLACKHFLISSDGSRHKHPHLETVARIIDEGEPDLELWFNYRSEQNRGWDDEYLKERYEYRAHYPQQGQEGIAVPLSDP